MEVVIVDGDVSYPPTSGKRLRTLNLMLKSAVRHRIAYIGRCDFRTTDIKTVKEFLGDHHIEPILVDHPIAKKSGVMFYGRLAMNLFSPLPYSVASHYSDAMRQAVQEHAARRPVDLWQFEWAPYMSTLENGATGSSVSIAPRLVVAHNVDALIWQRYYETARNPLKRWFLKQQWRKFRRFEENMFRKADHVVAVSEQDADLIRDKFGMPRVDVVDNGIDREFFEQATGTRKDNTILFLGALDWRPNLDAVDLLLSKIFPEVIQQLPEAELHIAGRHPSNGLKQQIDIMPGVHLHADVPDVRPFLAQSSVMVVPLRIGGGSRLKILEALACACPVVSTKVGAEGLRLEPGHHYVHAETAEMAEALVRVLRQPQPAREMAEQGRRVVLQNYDWESLALKQEQVWEKCMEEKAAIEGGKVKV